MLNRRFGCWITIGKSWVAKVLKAHELELDSLMIGYHVRC